MSPIHHRLIIYCIDTHQTAWSRRRERAERGYDLDEAAAQGLGRSDQEAETYACLVLKLLSAQIIDTSGIYWLDTSVKLGNSDS